MRRRCGVGRELKACGGGRVAQRRRIRPATERGGFGASGERHGETEHERRGLNHLVGVSVLLGAVINTHLVIAGPLSPVASPAAPIPMAQGHPVTLALPEALAIGLRDNRTIRSAYLERVAQRFDLFVAQTAFQPKLVVNADADATRTDGVAGTTTSVNPTASWLLPTGAQVGFSWARTDVRQQGATSQVQTTALTVTQPLFKGAGLAVNLAPIRIAELQEQIDKLQLKETVSDTVTTIILAYRALQQAQEQLRLARLSEDRTRALIETNKALIAAGRMAAADLVQTRSDAANQEVAVLAAEQARNSAQLALLRLLAVDLRTDVVAADPIKAEHVAVDLDQAIGIAEANRMDLLSQRKALAQDRQTLTVAQNNRLWNLSIVGSYDQQRGINPVVEAGQSAVVQGRDSSIGLHLSIPLGDWSYRQAYISAKTAVRTAELQVEELEQQVEGSVRDAAQGVELSWRQRVTAHDAERLAAEALDVAREKLKAGRASNFETISYEVALRQADAQALAADIGYLNALTSFDQQLGTTTETWRIALND